MSGSDRVQGGRRGREARGEIEMAALLSEITRYKLLSLGAGPVTNSDFVSIRGDRRRRRRYEEVEIPVRYEDTGKKQ